MVNYSAYCCGALKDEKSGAAYLLFKNGVYAEEKVVRRDARKVMSQHVAAVKMAVERLIELGAKNADVYLSNPEARDRILKARSRYVLQKNAHPPGFEKSDIYWVANALLQFDVINLKAVPVSENLRAQFLARKFIVENWEPRTFIWKGEHPAQTL